MSAPRPQTLMSKPTKARTGDQAPKSGSPSGSKMSNTGAKERHMSVLKKIFGPPDQNSGVRTDTSKDPASSGTGPTAATADKNSEPEAARTHTAAPDAVSETDTYATAVENAVSDVGSVTATESTQVQPSTMADEGDLREARPGTYVLPSHGVRSQAASLHGGTDTDPSVDSSVSGGVPVGREYERDDSDNFPSSDEEREQEEGGIDGKNDLVGDV